jgi:HlyD family secretion protein
MQRKTLSRTAIWSVAAVVAVATIWFVWPRAIAVDTAVIARGPMSVAIEEDAKTRVADLYIVSAPISGKVGRNPLRVGDAVVAGKTVVATIEPTAPAFLDERTRNEISAALNAAQSAVDLARHEIRRREAALEFSRAEFERASSLARSNVISSQALDKAKVDIETNEHGLAVAKAQLEMRIGERAAIAARLTDPDGESSSARTIQLSAPVTGRVLSVIQESEAVIQAGAPLIGIGDPLDLEIVADLLSADAVRVKVGAPVQIVDWGGPAISGRVERIDPAGFAKVSALGIEEQRVRTIIRLVDPPKIWSRLGHGFSAVVRIVVWQSDDALTIPVAALFRDAAGWAVFRIDGGRAKKMPIEIGNRNSRVAEILSGLGAGDEAILYPSDRITDGASVARRLDTTVPVSE